MSNVSGQRSPATADRSNLLADPGTQIREVSSVHHMSSNGTDERSGRGESHRGPRRHRRWRVGDGTGVALLLAATILVAVVFGLLPNDENDTANTSDRVSQPASTVALTTIPGGRVGVFNATEDGAVYASEPGAHAGSNKVLWVDATPQVVSYLKFRVDDIDDRVTRTILMLQATTGSPTGFSVHQVPNVAWDQATITYMTAPTVGEPLGSVGSFRSGSIVEVELDPFIEGVGDYAIALVTDSSTRMGFGSTESNGPVPQLLIRSED